MNSMQMYDKIKNYAYYIVIFIVSILATAFVPFIGSDIGAELALPQSSNEWVIFITTRLLVSLINVIIFYCFIQQAEINVREHPNYIEANRLLEKAKRKHQRKPRSPQRFLGLQWTTKGLTLVLSTLGATFALTAIILKFELTQLLTYGAVVVMGIVFGYLTMRKNEYYRTTEYLEYAKMITSEKENTNELEQ